MNCSRRDGFGLLDLVLLVVISMVVAAILLPTLLHLRADQRVAQSKRNLASIGKAIHGYQIRHGKNLKKDAWEKTLRPHMEDFDTLLVCPLRDKKPRNGGVYSYALNSRVERFALGDSAKIAVVTSDHRLIHIETKKCVDGDPVITGAPVARHEGNAIILRYGGNVRVVELDDINPAEVTGSDNKEQIVRHWMADAERGLICRTVVVLDDE